MTNEKRIPAGISTYPKVAIQLLNKDLRFYQSLCFVDCVAIPNHHFRNPLDTKHNLQWPGHYILKLTVKLTEYKP